MNKIFKGKAKLNRTIAIVICTVLTLAYYIVALFFKSNPSRTGKKNNNITVTAKSKINQ